MKESDWKKFKVIRERAIERFCTQALDEFGAVIANTDEPVHDRYLRLYELVQQRDKQLSSIFDSYSRSMASLQLTLIRSNGLADESLIAELSEAFRKQTAPAIVDSE